MLLVKWNSKTYFPTTIITIYLIDNPSGKEEIQPISTFNKGEEGVLDQMQLILQTQYLTQNLWTFKNSAIYLKVFDIEEMSV